MGWEFKDFWLITARCIILKLDNSVSLRRGHTQIVYLFKGVEMW